MKAQEDENKYKENRQKKNNKFGKFGQDFEARGRRQTSGQKGTPLSRILKPKSQNGLRF